MKDITDFTDPENEQEHRYCPICDAEIHAGTPLHQCSKKMLKALERRTKSPNTEDEFSETERTYDDKLKEYEDHFDNDSYYETEEDE